MAIVEKRDLENLANRLDLDQTRRFVGPDLGPNCLHSLSADGNSRKKISSKSNNIICLSGPDDGIPWKLQIDQNRNIQRSHSNLKSMEW